MTGAILMPYLLIIGNSDYPDYNYRPIRRIEFANLLMQISEIKKIKYKMNRRKYVKNSLK